MLPTQTNALSLTRVFLGYRRANRRFESASKLDFVELTRNSRDSRANYARLHSKHIRRHPQGRVALRVRESAHMLGTLERSRRRACSAAAVLAHGVEQRRETSSGFLVPGHCARSLRTGRQRDVVPGMPFGTPSRCIPVSPALAHATHEMGRPLFLTRRVCACAFVSVLRVSPSPPSPSPVSGNRTGRTWSWLRGKCQIRPH